VGEEGLVGLEMGVRHVITDGAWKDKACILNLDS
jgi:hypothetical protein